MPRSVSRVAAAAMLLGLSIACGVVRVASGQDQAEPGTLKGHLGAIAMGVLTPDGGRAITASTDQTARVWDLASGATIREYAGHTGPLYSLALSGDGRTLVTGAQDNSLRVWDVPQTVPLLAIAAHGVAVTGVAGTADGKVLVSVGADNKLRVWDTTQLDVAIVSASTIDPNAVSKVLSGHDAAITSVAVRPDGNLIATGDVSGRILFWSPFLEQPQGKVEGPGVVSLAFNGNNQQLFVCGVDGIVRQWDTPTPVRRQLDPLPQPVMRLAVSKGQPLALVATGDQVTRLINVDTAQVAREFPAAGAAVTAVAISGSNASIAVGDAQGVVRVLNAANGEVQVNFTVPGGAVHGLAFHNDNQRLLTTGADGFVRVWKPMPAAEGSPAGTPMTASSEGTQWGVLPGGGWVMATSGDASLLFAGGADGKVRQVATSDGSVQKMLEGHTGAITELAVSPNNQRLASVSRDGSLRVWNLNDGTVAFKSDHPGPVNSVAWSADGQALATAAEDGMVRLYSAEGGRLLEQFSGNPAGWSAVAWLGPAGQLVSVSADKSLRLMKRSAQRAIAPHTASVFAMAILGGQVLTAWKDGKVTLNDPNSGQSSREFVGCAAEIRSLAVRADGQRVAAGAADGKVYLWNAGNGELMQTLELGSPVVALAWGPDNQKLVAATEDRKLHWFGQPLPPTQPRPGNELVSHQQTVVDAPVAGMVFSPDNRSVRVAHGSGQLAVWAYAAPGSLRQMNQGGAVYGIAVSRDGKTIVSCGADQNVRVWDGTTGNQRFQMGGHQGAVHAVAISPDESFAVSSGADKTVRLWDIVGGRQLKQLATLEGTMYSVAIHPGGQQVATAGADRKVYLMDMISGAVQRTLEGHTDYIHCVAFNPTGTRLISFGYAGQVRVWDTASGNLVWENRVGRIGNYADYDAKGTSVLFSSGDGAARLVTLPESAR